MRTSRVEASRARVIHEDDDLPALYYNKPISVCRECANCAAWNNTRDYNLVEIICSAI